jgi:hypothetical protein
MTDDWVPDWIEARPGFIAIPDVAKDEFHERVFQYLEVSYGWGHSSRTIYPFTDVGIRVHELIANTSSGIHRSRLWILTVGGGLFTWTAGTGERDAGECELWEAATADAIAQLGQLTAVPWQAYLAQMPAALPYMRFRLEESVVLSDNVVLLPVSGVMTTDVMTNVGQALAGPHASALIRVEGSTDCYAWHADGQTAALRRLRLLTAVISFAWDCPWFLRDGPTEHLGASWAGAPGPVSGLYYGWSDSTESVRAPPAALVPPWVADVDASLAVEAQRDSPLHRAFLMHQEGLLVMREHPSLALLSFVASIETLAALSEKLERCKSCNVVIGSTARFKRIIATVLPDDEARYLGVAYDRRSRTVHDSRLHGRELVAGGWGEMSLYLPDKALNFEAGLVRTAQKASRALLWRALGIDRPPTDPLHSTD